MRDQKEEQAGTLLGTPDGDQPMENPESLPKCAGKLLK